MTYAVRVILNYSKRYEGILSNLYGETWVVWLAKLKMILVSGRSLGQGLGKEAGKFSSRYMDATATCQLDPEDMEKLGVSEGGSVKITSKHGCIVVKASKSRYAPHKGVVFIAYGPWVNALTSPETHGTGMPGFKGLEVEVEPVEEPVKPVDGLLKEVV
ncbi:molybdopterin dinucleotide-binding protein [Candidatus Bathyarchaeota archaeon]|nr:MAG: molybdopterin dinucleotide-binding protein [Candidatus Bathyarchaeota archaeon]